MIVAGTWELARQLWPEPLTGPYLNTAQRARLAEDLLLASDASLRPDDHSPDACRIREVAARIRDSRTPADNSLAQELGAHLASKVQLPDDAAYAAQREWQRLRDVPVTRVDRVTRDERAAVIARQLWRRAYRDAYRTAYATAAARIVAAATDTALAQPATWPALQPLISAAAVAIGEQKPGELRMPQSDDATIRAVQDAAAHPMSDPWRPVARTAWRAGYIAGTDAGTHAATNDIAADWHTRTRDSPVATNTTDGTVVQEWATRLLLNIGRRASNAEGKPAGGRRGGFSAPVIASGTATPAVRAKVPSRPTFVGYRPSFYSRAVPALRPSARQTAATPDNWPM